MPSLRAGLNNSEYVPVGEVGSQHVEIPAVTHLLGLELP